MSATPNKSPRTSRAGSGRRAGSRPGTRRPPAARAEMPPVRDGGRNSGALKHIGGSLSDDWNDLIAAETVLARCARESDGPIGEGDIDAAVSGLVGIAPQDEMEGMMAAQLIAAHSAVMECYRRAMSEEGRERDENLRHANRLTRAFAMLTASLQRYRGSAGRGLEQQKSAKQPQAKDAPLAPTPAAERPAVAAGTEAHTRSAKQPHATEIPPALAPRVERLRRVGARIGTPGRGAPAGSSKTGAGTGLKDTPLRGLSEEEVVAIATRDWVAARVYARTRKTPDLHALTDEEVKAMMLQELGRPPGSYISDKHLKDIVLWHRSLPAADAAEAIVRLGPGAPAGAAETGTLAKSEEQPHAGSLGGEELFGPKFPSPPAAKVAEPIDGPVQAAPAGAAETAAPARSEEQPPMRSLEWYLELEAELQAATRRSASS